MAVLDSITLLPDWIKMRWLEPYASAGLNRKTFKSLPRGVYSGFVVRPGPGAFEVQVKHDDPEGYGLTSGFSHGDFDPASSGWSVAVHASLQGYTSTVAILDSPASEMIFDLSAHKGTTVYAAIHVDYNIGIDTVGEVRIVNATDLDQDPTLINLARIDVPGVSAISQANIVLDDAAYPRVLPFANQFKYGFMDKFQATLLDELSNVSGSPALKHEELITTDGPQTVSLPPGFRFVVGGNDLWIFKNGVLMREGVGRDYVEVDRGDGFGEEVMWIGTIRAGDRVCFRIQEFSSVLTSRTQVLDESALINDNVVFFNFTGTGVTVLPDGPARVRVVIPGGGGANTVKTKTNTTGSVIPAYRAVSLNSDNTIKPFDPTVSGENFYGLTVQSIPDTVSGDVQLHGIVEGAAVVVSGGVPGQDVYVDHSGDGTLTITPPVAVSGQVVIVGQLDGPDGSITSVPVDIALERIRLT